MSSCRKQKRLNFEKPKKRLAGFAIVACTWMLREMKSSVDGPDVATMRAINKHNAPVGGEEAVLMPGMVAP